MPRQVQVYGDVMAARGSPFRRGDLSQGLSEWSQMRWQVNGRTQAARMNLPSLLALCLELTTLTPELLPVVQARWLLPPEAPSSVLFVEMASSRTFALAFHAEGRTWLYQAQRGTWSPRQPASSFEEHVPRIAGWLQEANREVRRVTPVQVIAGAQTRERPPLPNGCWIEAYAQHRKRRLAADPGEAYLLSYFAAGPANRGHTVLLWRDSSGWNLQDPAEGGAIRRIHPANPAPEDLARAALEGRGRAARFRLHPLGGREETPEMAAQIGLHPKPDDGSG